MAILTSFQMGFPHARDPERKAMRFGGCSLRQKNEFEKFGGLMDKVEKQVDTVQNTLGEIGGKTKDDQPGAQERVEHRDRNPVNQTCSGFEEIASRSRTVISGTARTRKNR